MGNINKRKEAAHNLKKFMTVGGEGDSKKESGEGVIET